MRSIYLLLQHTTRFRHKILLRAGRRGAQQSQINRKNTGNVLPLGSPQVLDVKNQFTVTPTCELTSGRSPRTETILYLQRIRFLPAVTAVNVPKFFGNKFCDLSHCFSHFSRQRGDKDVKFLFKLLYKNLSDE